MVTSQDSLKSKRVDNQTLYAASRGIRHDLPGTGKLPPPTAKASPAYGGAFDARGAPPPDKIHCTDPHSNQTLRRSAARTYSSPMAELLARYRPLSVPGKAFTEAIKLFYARNKTKIYG